MNSPQESPGTAAQTALRMEHRLEFAGAWMCINKGRRNSELTFPPLSPHQATDPSLNQTDKMQLPTLAVLLSLAALGSTACSPECTYQFSSTLKP